MDLAGWEDRYRSGAGASEDLDAPPTPLVVEVTSKLQPGKALDLACGSGRNALWLAAHGWNVTAVDGAPAAITILRDRAAQRNLAVTGVVADLEARQYPIEPQAWDLVLFAYYLQRDLFEPAKQGVKPGGVLVAIVHITEGEEQPTAHRVAIGELQTYFRGWHVLHHYEGVSRDPAHRRGVAAIAARRPPFE